MRRRELMSLLGGALLVGPLPAQARQQALPLVAVLTPGTSEINIAAFRLGLRELGYVEGQNIALEVRSAAGDNRRLPALAAELAALKPDVIVTNGGPAIRAAKKAAGTIPIIMAIIDEPVARGFAQSLARPGGKLTGQTILAAGVLGKRLQMLHDIVAHPGCVAALRISASRTGLNATQELAAAAKTLGLALLPISVAGVNELATGFAEMVRHHCRALVAMSDPLFVYARRRLVELAAQHRIATSYDNRLIVEAGGLMSYGPDTVDMFRQAAGYVDKILKGAKPADLPIEQPTRFTLAINLKTAQALGFKVPPLLLARADEVIR